MISVIIPTLNEAENLPRSIDTVRANEVSSEIIVVDGGSEDNTVVVAEHLQAKVFLSPVRQRAAQMNLGVRHSHGKTLLFLHADTLLPPDGLAKIESALQRDHFGGGAFARRFDTPSVFLRFSCWLAFLRNRLIGWHLGDQAMFVRRDLFERLGGFKPIHPFEDLDFSRRLGKITRVVTLWPPVVSSARRFSTDGPMRRTFKDLLLTTSYLWADLHTVNCPKSAPKAGSASA